MDTVLVRFHNDGPVREGNTRWPKGSLVPVTYERAQKIVAAGDGEIVDGKLPTGITAPKPRTKPVPRNRSKQKRAVLEAGRRDDAAVGIVIPMLNPGTYLKPCLDALAVSDAMPISEVVLVDDGSEPVCAPDAHLYMKRLGLRGRVLRLPTNTGFQAAVNAGAEIVAGTQLLMLSVDTEVKPGFLAPMLDVLDTRPDVGVVGNKHLNSRNGVDSAGSVWSWDGMTYRHRVRDMPAAANTFAEVDMTTFACCLIRRGVWDAVAGLSPEFSGLYWEDTDFCMRVRRRGWRIVYEPKSEIVHHGKHVSRVSGKHYLGSERNRSRFIKFWAAQGYPERFARERGDRCDDATRIVVGMITLNEEEFVAAALESVYADADLIVVPVGAVNRAVAAGLCGPNGYPTDATMDILRSFPDPDNKLKIVGPRMWGAEKSAMRNAVLDHCRTTDMVVMLDADEVMYPGAIWGLFANLRQFDVIRPAREDHWNDLDTVATGHGWQRIREPRVYRFHKGMRYTDNHGVPNGLGARVLDMDDSPWAHYAYVKPVEKLRRKVDYYREVYYKPGEIDPDYIDNVFLRWRQNKEAVEGPNGPGTYILPALEGETRRFDRRHPPSIERRILSGEMPREDW